MATNILSLKGQRLASEEAERLEKEAEEMHQDDCAFHVLFLGYYRPRSVDLPARREARYRHVLWMIKNAPGLAFPGSPDTSLSPLVDSSVYDEARRLWLKAVADKAESSDVLRNAAAFLRATDPRASIDMFKRCHLSGPGSGGALLGMVSAYVLEINQSEVGSRARIAAEAIRDVEEMLNTWRPSDSNKLWVYPDLAAIALEADQTEKARAYANDILSLAARSNPPVPQAGAAVHRAHLVLGHIAMEQGDTERAKTLLLRAGNVKSAPTLEGTGPGMRLARQLLGAGERQTVIEYLQGCASFWQGLNHGPAQWIDTLERGKDVEFGPIESLL